MSYHDPKKVIELLREHLTQPEANIAFLCGAGTSCAVRVPAPLPGNQNATRALIPDIAELTNTCRKEIHRLDVDGSNKFAEAVESIENEVQIPGRKPNIEDILSCVRRKISAMGGGDRLAGLALEELKQMETAIRKAIAEQVNPEASSFPSRLPHEDFVEWISRIPRKNPAEIFTTNYDVLFEMALEAGRVPSFDGFVGCNRPFFFHESLLRPDSTPGSDWVRLWKVHGSINWKLDTVKGKRRVVRVEPHNDGEMILPSHHKYDESRKLPYTALLDRLTRVMERDAGILFVCGYSFSDEHINAIIFDALEAKKRPHVIALQYVEIENGSVLFERACRHSNLLALGPSGGVIRGEWGEWKLPDLHAAHVFSDAFSLNEVEEGGSVEGRGRLLLGDFAVFSKFMASLSGSP